MKEKAVALFEAVQGDKDLLTNKGVARAYDAGAVAVLTELANGRMLTMGNANQLEYSSATKNQTDVCKELYNGIMEKVKHDPELVAMLWNLDNEYTMLESMSNADYFVQAFIEGYKFHKSAVGGDGFEN